MIRYNLTCKSCLKKFDSWFSASKQFDKIKKLNLLSCPKCKSNNIEKSLMAPNLNKTKKSLLSEKNLKFKRVKSAIRNYQRYISKNFNYVGDNFTYEARSIHYNKKNKSKKGIYGKAKISDIKELHEEGIVTELVPWFNDSEN